MGPGGDILATGGGELGSALIQGSSSTRIMGSPDS